MVQVDHDFGRERNVVGVQVVRHEHEERDWERETERTSAKQDTLATLTRLMALGHASVKQTDQIPMSHSRRSIIVSVN